MTLVARLDSLHAWARRQPPLHRLALISRILLAVSFIPTGLTKVLGHRFMTIVDLTDPISYFFDAMYRTGPYWRFLGWGQVIAGLLLLFPRTATLGAVLFLPIILNVLMIVVALEFTGTPVVAALMLLANVYLLCWDYDRLKYILFAPAARPEMQAAGFAPRWSLPERVGFALGAVTAMTAFLWTRGFVPRQLVPPAMVLGGVAVLLVLAGWIGDLRRGWRERGNGAAPATTPT